MGEGDFMPVGGHRKRYDPKHAKKIKDGGRKAQQIAAKSHKHHHEVEVPAAEAELAKDLAGLNGSSGGSTGGDDGDDDPNSSAILSS